MVEDNQSEKGRNYQKLVKYLIMGAGLGFILALVLGYTFDFIFYSILLYITVLVSVTGYVGGIWLWEYLASSEIIKGDMKRVIKIVVFFALAGFVTFISFSIYIAFYSDFGFLQAIVSNANYLLLFMFCYFIGYLLSIWNPTQEAEAEPAPKSESKFRIDWEITKPVLKIAIPVCVIGGGILLVIGFIQGQFMEYLFYCGIFAVLVVGFCLGFLIWEHLKKSNLITGEFQGQLKGISIASTVVLGGLTAWGFYVVSRTLYPLYQELILYYTIFLICMFFYFLGLWVSIMKSK